MCQSKLKHKYLPLDTLYIEATNFAASIFNGATSFSGNLNSVSGDASSLNLTEESQSQNNMGTGLTTIVTVET